MTSTTASGSEPDDARLREALRLAFVYAFRPPSAGWLPRWVEETLASSNPVTP